MTLAIIFLIVLGLAFIFAEFYLPGGVMGVIGGLMLVVSVIMGYTTLGVMVGNAMLLALIILGLVLIPVFFKLFNVSPIGKKMTLKTSMQAGNSISPLNENIRIGMKGRSIGMLRPYGTIRIGEDKMEAMAETGMIEGGTPVEVVLVEPDRILVRASAD